MIKRKFALGTKGRQGKKKKKKQKKKTQTHNKSALKLSNNIESSGAVSNDALRYNPASGKVGPGGRSNERLVGVVGSTRSTKRKKWV